MCKDLRTILNQVSDNLSDIEQSARIADALQEDVLENVFQNSHLVDGENLPEDKTMIYFTARQKSYFAEAVNMYVKKVIDDLSILRQRVEKYAKGGATV